MHAKKYRQHHEGIGGHARQGTKKPLTRRGGRKRMDDQEFKELVLKEIKDAKAFRKNIKDALKKALYGDFDFNVLTPLGEECPHEREKYIKAPHEEGHNREEMNKVEELKMLKDLLVKWEMKEGDAKNAALGLIYGGGFIQFFPVGRDNC